METAELIDRAAQLLGGFPQLADRLAYTERTLKRVRSGEIPMSSKLEERLDRIIADKEREEAAANKLASSVRSLAEPREGFISNVDPNPVKMRMIPVFTFVPGGPPVEYEVLPESWQDAHAYSGNDPDAFALRLVGDSMMPEFKPGTIITVSPNSKPSNGDLCIATIKGEGSLFKIFYVSGDHKIVTLMSYNETKHPPIIRPREDFHEIFRVVATTRNY